MNFIMTEDHNLVRQGVSKIIEEKSSFKCAGTFSSIDETKAFLENYCKNPGYEKLICIIDLNLGNDNGLSLISFIKKTYKNIFCICYSMFKGAGIVEQAVQAGASGYVSKNADLEVLLKAMNETESGNFFMEGSLTSNYVVYTCLIQSLTKREKELADLFFQNKKASEISETMGISERAIDNYLTRIYSKLGVAGKKELIERFGE